MKRNRDWFWIIPRATLDDMDVPSVLDMLRYDSAVVQSNPPDGFYMFKRDGELACGPNVERLRSRGVIVESWQIVQGEEYRYELIDRARARIAAYKAATEGAAS